MFVCILDFEATCEANVKHFDNEIIEFPSILYRINNIKIEYVSEFQEYVKPKNNPILTKFCTSLTKITQEKVDSAQSFPTVYNNHLEWLKQHVSDLKQCIIVTCGHWDIKTMIRRDAKRWNIKLHHVYTRYCNIKDEFVFFYNKKIKSMIDMLEHQNIQHEGVLHSGIDDCRNIAKILIKMILDGFDVEKQIFINQCP